MLKRIEFIFIKMNSFENNETQNNDISDKDTQVMVNHESNDKEDDFVMRFLVLVGVF